jgi:hypothetical protein
VEILVPILTAGGAFAGTYYTGRLNKKNEVDKKQHEKEIQKIESDNKLVSQRKGYENQLAVARANHQYELERERNRTTEELRKIHYQDLRNTRITNYKELWTKLNEIKDANLFIPTTSPDASMGLSIDDGRNIDRALEQWYYTNGGFFMTDASRAKYEDRRKYLSENTSSGNKNQQLSPDVQKEVRSKVQELGKSLINEVRTNESLIISSQEKSAPSYSILLQ